MYTNKNLVHYNQHEIENFKNGKIKIVQKIDDIDKFIENAQKNSSNTKLFYGKIGKPIAYKINKVLGINLENYNISLQTSAVRHIIKNHGNNFKENKRGQGIITSEDFRLIPQIISDFDYVEKTGITENNNQTLTFQKQIGNNYYLVSYTSNKNHNLEVKTMWKIKTKKKNSATASDALMPRSQTSKTNSSTSSSTSDNSTIETECKV